MRAYAVRLLRLRRPGHLKNRTGERVGANEILAPYWGFFSTGHFAGHERKFGRDFKGILSKLYREFESRLVRQQVINNGEII